MTLAEVAEVTSVPSTVRVTERRGKLIFAKVHVVVELPSVDITVDVDNL